MDDFWNDAEIIHAYTRRQAIEDGVLVDLMQPETKALVENAGIKVPVAMTATAFSRCIWPIENAEGEAWLKNQCQDLKGRLWDVLWMFRCASHGQSTDTVLFQFIVQDWETKRRRRMTLKAVIHGGGQGEPVITIMLPEED
ncbi:MAG: DUF6573 family protein [Bacillota bacterium]